MIVVRGVFQAKYGKGNELVELLKEGNVLWPAGAGRNARILTDLSGPFFTVVSEAEFDSFSAWESRGPQIYGDAHFAAWFERMTALVEGGRREFYNVAT
ncbi:MAG: hypothetical protein HZB53_10385 [Chloroflexi bacterium]|nr:hypothetical protein [Chloroflexota bacterium]